MSKKPKLTPADERVERGNHVRMEARKAYNRLKRRGLMMDCSIWPDYSPEVVAVLAVFATNIHQYLKRRERLEPRRDRTDD